MSTGQSITSELHAFFKGNIVPLSEAKVNVMTHALHYGTGVFEGIRGNWNEDKDELYETAIEVIKSEGKASTSFLQRKLQIGYNRAARIIDMMEQEGIVSKANHVGKRDVL